MEKWRIKEGQLILWEYMFPPVGKSRGLTCPLLKGKRAKKQRMLNILAWTRVGPTQIPSDLQLVHPLPSSAIVYCTLHYLSENWIREGKIFVGECTRPLETSLEGWIPNSWPLPWPWPLYKATDNKLCIGSIGRNFSFTVSYKAPPHLPLVLHISLNRHKI